jgi:hypothetical protein
MSQPDNPTDHDQDREQPLPGWWRAIFWGTIVAAAGSYVWF